MGTPFGGISLSGSKYVTRAHHARLDFTDDSFTVNVRYKGSAAGPILNKFDTATTKGWSIESVAGGNARFTVNGTAISGGSVLDNAWHDIECVRDANSDLLRMFIDGTEITPVSFTAASTANSAAFQAGRSPNGASTLTGSISEVRLSRGVRHINTFTVPYTQFEDDGGTRLLWHFNEGKGSTAYDMSSDAVDEFDYGARYDGTMSGGSGTYVYGPLMTNPARMIHEAVWRSLDVYAPLQAYGSATRLKRHRARQGDKSTARILSNKRIEGSDFPGIFTFPQSLAGIPVETSAWNVANIPVILLGGVENVGAFAGSDLWWLALRAVLAQEETDAGHFFHTRVQKWVIGRSGFDAGGIADGTIWGAFTQEISFEVNCDIRTSGTP